MKALVSIHDCMPETMDRVEALLDWLGERGVPPVALLIVPGKDWSTDGLKRLRQFAQLGHELVAHGWSHYTEPRRLFHRIHSTLISRNVAEHLDLDADGVFDLMQRSAGWFTENNLTAPETYVPPSWALGIIRKNAFQQLPYKIIETTRGVIYTRNEKRMTLPLTGFEADTAIREAFLSRWNKYQMNTAMRTEKPLRISIHPDDLQLRLTDQMETLIKNTDEFISYRDL
ncbi:MAG: polysaccharide deacetylase family protein [Coraliomargaritaceae bacterium]